MKKFLLASFFIATITLLYYWRTRDVIMQFKFDVLHDNPYVKTKVDIENVLAPFPLAPFEELEKIYLETTEQDIEPFKTMLKGRQFYRIPQLAIYQKLVGDFRIKDFLPKDSYYKQSLYSTEDSLYFLVDVKMLFQVLEFQDKLEAAGHDRDAFFITNGYRHPHYNALVGGASQSRHIVGEAVDITAKDINKDGQINQEDKAIILAIAEEVVGNDGGVGMYPNTMSIHMDTRGYRARWNSF